jgi:hypothetical protein
MSYVGNVPTTAAFPFDQFSGNGSTTAFSLSQAPASTTSIVVAVSGVVQNPNTYSVSGATLTFTAAPPSGTNNIGVLFLGLPSIVGVPNAATVGISQLSATGSPSSTTFLRGDNTWAGVSSSGQLLRITRYSTAGSGTWTKPSDTISILIRTVAGGGGGGGGSTGVFAGGGGSAGGYAEIYIASAASSYAYTVGAGGAGGAINGTGGTGGATTIAGIANGGGSAGGPGAAGYGGNAGIGSAPTGGSINIRGGSGNGGTEGDAAQANGTGGVGGSSVFGGGGRGAGFNSPTGGVGVFGGGGGGGAGGNAGAGGAGGAGYIEIWEYS